MKFAIVLIAATFIGIAVALPANGQNQGQQAVQPSITDGWLDLFSAQLQSSVQERVRQLRVQGKDNDLFPDPWNFPNTTHNMNWFFREGEINTYNPVMLGLSVGDTLEFTLNLATNQVRYKARFPAVTFEGQYDLWIDHHSIISPIPYERRRGQGDYKHIFHNVDFSYTFNLHSHPSGRISVTDETTQIVFESCDVWSENYTINGRPIDWEAASREWKQNFDSSFHGYQVLYEEALGFYFGFLFGWPAWLSAEEIVGVLQNWGADIIG